MIDFRPANLTQDFSKCLKYKKDAFVCSGSPDSFYKIFPDDRAYYSYLKNLQDENPKFVTHIISDNKVVGQIELRLLNEETGYVGLYYLIESLRGRGFSKLIDQYTCQLFKELGLKKAKLTVTIENEPAMKFYQKMDWYDLGPRGDYPQGHFFEKNIEKSFSN